MKLQDEMWRARYTTIEAYEELSKARIFRTHLKPTTDSLIYVEDIPIEKYLGCLEDISKQLIIYQQAKKGEEKGRIVFTGRGSRRRRNQRPIRDLGAEISSLLTSQTDKSKKLVPVTERSSERRKSSEKRTKNDTIFIKKNSLPIPKDRTTNTSKGSRSQQNSRLYQQTPSRGRRRRPKFGKNFSRDSSQNRSYDPKMAIRRKTKGLFRYDWMTANTSIEKKSRMPQIRRSSFYDILSLNEKDNKDIGNLRLSVDKSLYISKNRNMLDLKGIRIKNAGLFKNVFKRSVVQGKITSRSSTFDQNGNLVRNSMPDIKSGSGVSGKTSSSKRTKLKFEEDK